MGNIDRERQGTHAVKVVDIRNLVTASSVELIRVSDTNICYAEEKNEEGHNSLFLLCRLNIIVI